jgi:hypothetical protein
VDTGGPAGQAGSEHWRRVRRYLNEHRHELALAAVDLYPRLGRVRSAPLLCQAAWIAPEPISLAGVRLAWDPAAPPPQIDGTEPQSKAVRPVADGRRHPAYAQALAGLAPPRMLENRACYRLTDLAVDGASASMTFGPGAYFDGINVGEAVAHEFADRHMSGTTRPRLADLPFRALVGDPTNPARRAVNPAISMLTLRRDRDGAMTFLLHSRDPAQVAHGGGLYQVIPVGVFQPSSDTDAALHNDFDLWRCAVREYSEEFLGHPEIYGHDSTAFDYDTWPVYRALTRARDEGSLRSYLLAVGVDPLSLAADILAVTVIDADVFDDVFAGLVAGNTEGRVLGHDTGGFAFTRGNVERFAAHEPMQAAGAAVLTLAWEQREQLTLAANLVTTSRVEDNEPGRAGR